MADKRQIKQNINRLKRIETWKLVVLLVVMLFVSATFLRLNNIGMADRRQAVHSADKAGDIKAIESRLFDLQRFSNAHMNADSGDVYLQQQYNRDAEAAVKNAASGDAIDSNAIINQAVRTCHERFPQDNFGSTVYGFRQCVAEELAKVPGAPDLSSAIQQPNANLYRYSFSSPVWSPDFAGWSVVVCLVIVVVIIIRAVSMGVLRLLLKRHYRGV